MKIRKLKAGDASKFFDVRLMGLREFSHAFGRSADEFQKQTLDSIADQIETGVSQGNFILGAFNDEDELLGVVGFLKQPGEKVRHTAILWGMYVIPQARRKGVARELIKEFIAEVRKHEEIEQIKLTVESGNLSARRLYESFGFEPFGTEPRVLKVDGKYYHEDHMMLRLKNSGN
ncbi:GNAT family N-acetyltransferase [candidate division KSB1 bacterium]|nr:GNAT family N-acetyltransferase [candidate division KSB1 bacterium]NIR73386.1 GNAT family N-acetyltransferase [candidate division KSB1 bacterium]NIS28385.1 GNAT family N-acetyltransferase [candidate division KSB1 bacterium]NIT75266.1 GNAT family N-acetyltransferase [candidate division KSB1 bacterium]NIU29113.1 GNAT family N-acetyltransferase [candidate division KSB1 bacterium]